MSCSVSKTTDNCTLVTFNQQEFTKLQLYENVSYYEAPHPHSG